MPTNKRVGNKIPRWAERDITSNRVDTATYVGIIKANADPSRAGRLRIWIPDMGGNEDDESTWKTVNYASPFFGVTYNKNIDAKENKWDLVHHSYGMWMVPPDIGNEVLCTFVNGDPDRGYWFACVNTGVVSHHMTPGLASSLNVDKDKTSDAIKNVLKDSSNIPVTEFNENVEGAVNSEFYYNNKPVHESQMKHLLEEGLDKDIIRGAITSSSQRESPSTVFGISTPGRYINDTATDAEYLGKLENGTLTDDEIHRGPRQGGHQFVMDDGDLYNRDNLIRLRTAGGHQILMNDSEKILYIANSSGSVWMEFGDNGQMYFYSGNGFNVRTQGALNLHSDTDIFINANKNINIRAAESIKINCNELSSTSVSKTTIFAGGLNLGSDADFALYASGKGSVMSGKTLTCKGDKILLNSAAGVTVNKPAKIPVRNHNDASRNDPNSAWEAVNNSLESIVTIAPAHEPWTRASGVLQGKGNEAGATDEDGNPIDPGGKRTDKGGPPQQYIGPVNCSGTGSTDPGPALAQKKNVEGAMPKDWINRPDAPNPPGGLGPLTKWHMKCVMAQMAYSESRFNYEVKERNRGNYLGRYQIGAAVLVEQGYLQRAYYKQYETTAVRYPDAWTGSDNIRNQDEFLANKATQEKVMYNLMSANYKQLVGNKGIKPDDDLCTVAGMLCVAQLLGASGAKTWRYNATGADANGSTGDLYFNRGRYAIDIVSNSSPGGDADNNVVTTTTRNNNYKGKGGLTDAAKKALDANINPLDVIQFTKYVPGRNTGSGTYEAFMQCDDSFRAMILGAAKEYKEKYGEKLICESSLRTDAQQMLLYNAWKDAGGTGRATVNTSYGRISQPLQKAGTHGSGIAIDTPDYQMRRMQDMGLFEKYGLQWLGPSIGDWVHAQRPYTKA